MIILHAGEEDGQLLLWAETPASTDEGDEAPKRPRATGPIPYPYDAGPAGVAGAILTILPSKSLPGGNGQPPLLWTPTVKGRPVPSSGLIAPLPAPDAVAELAPYTITCLRLPPPLALDVLCHCADRELLQEGLLVGPTLAFWVRALRFAGALAVREQLVPGLRRIPAGASKADVDTWRACWQPVLVGPEAARLNRLARAMPPACRALGRSPEHPPERSPVESLTAFLGVMTDLLVRTALSDAKRSVGHVQAPRLTFPSLHDQWAYALRSADGTLTGPPTELQHLADEVRAWQRPITVAASSSFQLCFRLEEPSEESDAQEETDDNESVSEHELNGETEAPKSRRRRRRRRGRKNEESNGSLARTHAPRPTPHDSPWRVRYLLQARDDNSLLIPVEDAWNPTGQVAALFQSRGFSPREYLLTTLGQAAALCPPVEESLKAAAPSEFRTDAIGAHHFLTEHAGLLEQAGFSVLLPTWWSSRGTHARLAAQAMIQSADGADGEEGKFTSAAGLSMGQILQFDWRVALGEHQLDLAELEALAKLKVPLVKVRGQWVQVSAEEIQALIALMQKRQSAAASLREVVQMALGGGQAPGGLAFGGVSANGWVAQFLAQLEGREPFAELPVPEHFQGTLRPYQVRGYSWLAFLRHWGLGACLADDMGLGKTVQTLALILRDWETTNRPTLLICPTSVVANWKKEAERFTPDLPVMIHHGGSRAKGASFAKEANKHALVVSSYSLLYRDREALSKVKWAGVVLDEAQNVKNPDTKQAQAARSINSDYRIALTGTPVENHVGDLWSIFEFLNPGWLGGQGDFRKRFLIPIQANRDEDAANRLKRMTGPFLLRRLKTDRSVIADLPEKMEMKVYCTLTKEQATLYKAVVEEVNRTLEDSDGIQRRGQILATLTKLKQVCNHPAHFLGDHSALAGRSGKLTRLTEMLAEIAETNEKSLVFTQFTEMGTLLQKHLQDAFGREVLFLHGGVSRTTRSAMVERFQTDDAHGPRIFILSLKAGGTGLNLTAANHVFHFDRWWNPAVEDQATDRAFRIGQTRNVQVHKFVCAGTLEEKIDEMITKKQKVAAWVVGAGEGWLTELSNDQLRELWTLRQDAVEED
jgi:SNF2 family DNA or RNA helicase